MADIDQIALDVARRFTQDDQPQRRAQLQVAILEAIRAAQEPFPVAELVDIRDQLHGMATTMAPNFCDLAANLQAQVQVLLNRQRAAAQEADHG